MRMNPNLFGRLQLIMSAIYSIKARKAFHPDKLNDDVLIKTMVDIMDLISYDEANNISGEFKTIYNRASDFRKDVRIKTIERRELNKTHRVITEDQYINTIVHDIWGLE